MADAVNLPKARDVLLPLLETIEAEVGNDFEFAIQVNFTEHKLIVRAYRFATQKQSSFNVPNASIEDGSYLTNFRQNVLALVADLQSQKA